MNKIFTKLLIIIIFFQLNCISTMIKNSLKNNKAGGRFFLHENPKKGDFAVYKTYGYSKNNINVTGAGIASAFGSSAVPKTITTRGSIRYEIIEVTEETYRIRQTSKFTSSVSTIETETILEFETDKSGIQLRTTIVKYPYISEPITVEPAKPGEDGFVETIQDKNAPKVKINSGAGEFVTTPIYAVQKITTNIDNAVGKGEGITNTNAIVFLNPKVKFQMVYTQGSTTSNISSEASKELKTLLNALNSTAKYFANPAAGANSIFRMGLKEFILSEAKGIAQNKLDELIGDIDKIQANGSLDVSSISILSEQGNIFEK